jgi:hypothetical protein
LGIDKTQSGAGAAGREQNESNAETRIPEPDWLYCGELSWNHVNCITEASSSQMIQSPDDQHSPATNTRCIFEKLQVLSGVIAGSVSKCRAWHCITDLETGLRVPKSGSTNL